MFHDFFSERRAVYENVEEHGRAIQDTDGNIIRCMRLACRYLRLQTHIQNVNNYHFSTAKKIVTARHLTMLRYSALSVLSLCA